MDTQVITERNNLSEELYRVRTTQQAAAHALDRIRQFLKLDLIQSEHPADTATRIERAITQQQEATHD